MKQCWLDLRGVGELKAAARTEAIHQRVDAIVDSEVAELEPLPPDVTRVLQPLGELPGDLGRADVVIVDPARHGDPNRLAREHPGVEFGAFLEVVDSATLDEACRYIHTYPWTVLSFRDPTKIPLEIVLAATADAKGSVVTVAADPEEAAILFGVLERGCDGVMMAPAAIGDATRLRQACTPRPDSLALVEFTVVATTHAGMGERACVDTCTYLHQDEGILVGSQSRGLVLCASETHPLPYMPTRPFRVNAGAIMSYTLGPDGRTSYLSELHSGSQVLAVDSRGRTRLVTVGRTKIETRPLRSVDATTPEGTPVNLILQDDWHVRVLGPGGTVLNSTALRPGDRVLGYLPPKGRHVGYPIDELCYEQ